MKWIMETVWDEKLYKNDLGEYLFKDSKTSQWRLQTLPGTVLTQIEDFEWLDEHRVASEQALVKAIFRTSRSRAPAAILVPV